MIAGSNLRAEKATGRIDICQVSAEVEKIIRVVENKYDILISKNRRFTNRLRCSTAYYKNSLSEILSGRSGGFFL